MDCKTVKGLCIEYTNLAESDIEILEAMALQIPYTAEMTGTDIFIDAPLKDGVDAVVLAWACPKNRSLYGHSVVGELAYATSEPAVYRTFKTGGTSRNVRGVSQEGVPIAQTVVAIRNATDKVIGTQMNFNPNVHMLVSMGGMKLNGEWKVYDYIPFPMLRKQWQTVVLKLIRSNLNEAEKKIQHLLQKAYSANGEGFYVYAPRQKGNVKVQLGYIGRYIRRPAIALHRIEEYGGQYVTYRYHDKKDGQEKLVFIITLTMRAYHRIFFRLFFYPLIPSSSFYCLFNLHYPFSYFFLPD